MHPDEHIDGEHQPPLAPSRVAVIAVHGVGPAEPHSTARHIADLLLGLGRLRLDQPSRPDQPIPWGPATPPYHGFHTQPIQVPLKPVHLDHPEEAMKRMVDFAPDSDSPQSGWRALLHFWDERRGYVAKVFAGRPSAERCAAVQHDIQDRGKLAHEFMRAQLAGYVSERDGQSFDTIRMETERPARDGVAARTVHLYESYWADLARPQNSIVSFLLAFYQLMLHLGSLSRTAVDYAAVEHCEKRSWRWHTFFQAIAVRILVLPIPILNLILVVAGLGVLPLKVHPANRPLIAILFAAFAALVGMLFWTKKFHVPKTPWAWLLLLIVAAGAGAEIASALLQRVTGATLFAMEWWIFGGVILLLLFKSYDEVRRGAFATGLVMLLVCFGGFLYCLYQAKGSENGDVALEKACIWTIQLIMGGFVLSWLSLLVCILAIWILNFVCQWAVKGDQAQKARARAALRTGRLTLAVSASLFLVVTIALWAGAFFYTGRQLQLYAGAKVSSVPLGSLGPTFRTLVPSIEEAILWVHQPPPSKPDLGGLGPSCLLPKKTPRETMQERLAAVDWCQQKQRGVEEPTPVGTPFLPRLEQLEQSAGIQTQGAYPSMPSLSLEDRLYHLELRAGLATESEFSVYARTLLLISVTAGLPVILVGLALALILLVWMVAPSLLPKDKDLNQATNAQCRQLGNWFSRGLDSTRAVTTLLWHSIFTVAIIFGALDFANSHGWLGDCTPLAALMQSMTHVTLAILDLVGAKLAVSGTVIAAVVYKYGRTALDIVLDVDNYLRTSPLDSTPRARIVERYVSLLRFIANQKDEAGQPFYSSVVIVAHSLGALISADLLHFLQREGDPELASLGYDRENPQAKATAIHLLTFGNPLRQLLNRFFPHLYWWIREEPDNGWKPLKPAAAALPAIAAAATPDPGILGAALWVNAYRSGDFVGRSLWLDNWYARTVGGSAHGQYPQAIAVAGDHNPPARVESCIGLGGHNDYWNRSAPDMAKHLDTIICL